ncbi:glycosyltransferase family 2 protein [Candidatus Peregrinibacteria bacterium]|nr:glycosyltransferase family 2 protein [Candidatus Peregrinibacteria bacterium]MBI3816080.1 glycosyltransferase family 2 protein [Candidatus Peregrinibacteria bacterium]
MIHECSVSLVVPAYNEEDSISSTVSRCLKILREIVNDYEVLILDDGSTDSTSTEMECIQREDPEHVRLFRHATNRGIADTFEELYRRATKDIVFLVPADGEFPPEILPECLPLLDRYDIIICRRRIKRYTLYRRVLSALYELLPRFLFGVNLYDAGSVKCIRSSVVRSVPVRSRSVFVEAERLILAAKRGYRIGYVDIAQELRRAGKARGAAFGTVLGAGKDLLLLWVRFFFMREKTLANRTSVPRFTSLLVEKVGEKLEAKEDKSPL